MEPKLMELNQNVGHLKPGAADYRSRCHTDVLASAGGAAGLFLQVVQLCRSRTVLTVVKQRLLVEDLQPAELQSHVTNKTINQKPRIKSKYSEGNKSAISLHLFKSTDIKGDTTNSRGTV